MGFDMRETKSGLLIPAETKLPLTPDWERFMGNNHEAMPVVNYRRMGGFHTENFIGKPLDGNMWRVIVECFGVQWMRIYKPHSEQWTDYQFGRTIYLHLDESDKVSSVSLWF